MKHNTHIYIARKAIDFLYDGLGNLYPESSISGHKETRKKARAVGKVLQRLLNNHKADVSEASWAPDDILRDNRLYHIFKLFTEEEFTDYADFFKETHTKQDINYYRASGGGGLPYRVEHLARGIRDMKKLRGYNDNYSVKQMMYQLLLLSHYVVDAHVPMHCDIRDDRPSAAKPSQGNYYKESWHAKIEKMWDDACTPVGIQEGCLERERAQDRLVDTALTPFVTFDLSNSNHIKEIQTCHVEHDDLMDFMIDVCITSKQRSQRLFPLSTPDDVSFGDDFNVLTREIFAAAIGNLISVWICIWRDR